MRLVLTVIKEKLCLNIRRKQMVRLSTKINSHMNARRQTLKKGNAKSF